MENIHFVEETEDFLPDYNKLPGGVIPVAVQNIETGQVIHFAYTNQKALDESLKTGFVIFWSPSHNTMWVKGKTSCHYFDLIEVYVNCEQNSLVYKVKSQDGDICHTRNKTGKPHNCFYRRLDPGTMKLKNLNL